MSTSDSSPGGSGAGLLSLGLDRVRFPRKVLMTCFALELLLYIADYFLNYGRLIDDGPFRRLWTTTIESSFPSFFSIGQTLLAALTLWFIVRLVVAGGESRRVIGGWVVMALFFTYMAVDDGAKFHERIGTFLGELRDSAGFQTSFPSYNWQFFLLPFFGAMGLFMLVFIWFQMKDRMSRILVFVAVGMLITAVGIDFIEGLDQEHPWNIYESISERLDLDDYAKIRFRQSGYKTVQHFFKSAEELFFEAGAISVLWFLFLRKLLQLADEVRIRIR